MKIRHNLKAKSRSKFRIKAKLQNMQNKLPRLTVYRSNKCVYAQVRDDRKGKTVVTVSDKHLKITEKTTKSQKAYEVGLLIAKKSLEHKIKNVIFDRNRYRYHGRIKQVAEGARKGGLTF